MNLLGELQQWYHSQCNEDWEHQFGITIDTLDNPGWTVTIDLKGTDLEGRSFQTIETLESEGDWLKCSVTDLKFEGFGGPNQLEQILRVFLKWANQVN